MRNTKKVELELITDADMFIFFEKGMRGEVCYISADRYSKPNSNYLNSYDPEHKSFYIQYYILKCK